MSNYDTKDNVFEFSNLSFSVPEKSKRGREKKPNGSKKLILQNVSARVTSGHVLAILGPSGAGKTTLINVLTLNAFGGEASGLVKLNNCLMDLKTFTEHSFVVTQVDSHWPYLTCLETMKYAAELYLGKSSHKDERVDAILKEMGLESCRDTKVGNEFFTGLSGGQKRRLSIAIALIKRPKLIFLDEPTSGLDAAAAANIMTFITELAQLEKLIVVATIHQPSTKVYNGFDELMLLSQGRVAFCGAKDKAISYFASIGKECPEFSNPAEFFLDLVNHDFLSDEEVFAILDTWEERKGSLPWAEGKSRESRISMLESGTLHAPTFAKQVLVMLCRHMLLTIRDPMLYLGRSIVLLFQSFYFALVYYNARVKDQDQVLNRMWLCIWLIGPNVMLCMATVFFLNVEFLSIRKEIKNGMASPSSYLLSKTLIEVPIMFIMAMFALGIPAYALGNYDGNGLMRYWLAWTVCFFAWESLAQILSVTFDNPIMGVCAFVAQWFSGFLYGGFLIPAEDMIWPLKIFFYILPLKYGCRSMVNTEFSVSTFEGFEDCLAIKSKNVSSGGDPDKLCFGTKGEEVVNEMARVYPLFGYEQADDMYKAFGFEPGTEGTKDEYDPYWADVFVMFLFAVLCKVGWIFLLTTKSRKSSKITAQSCKLKDAIMQTMASLREASSSGASPGASQA